MNNEIEPAISLRRSSCLKNWVYHYHPLLFSIAAAALGWGLMLMFITVNLHTISVDLYAIESFDVTSKKYSANEAISRIKVGVTFLVFITASLGVVFFSIWQIRNRFSKQQRNRCWVAVVVYILLTNLILYTLDCVFGINTFLCKAFGNPDHSFLDLFGKDRSSSLNIFQQTIATYPTFLNSYPQISLSNFLELLEILNSLAYFLAFVSGSVLFSAAATLTPSRTYKLLRHKGKHSQVNIERAARQIAKQLRWLKYYIFSGGVILISALLYLSSAREWPLAYFLDSGSNSAIAFQDTVQSTVLFQAGHFAVILIATFLPIILRLKLAGERLADLEQLNLDNRQRKSWMVDRGLLLTTGETLQQTIAIISPFSIPIVSWVFSSL